MQQLKANYRDARLGWWEVFMGMYTDCQDVSILSSRASVPSSPLYTQQSVPVNIVRPIVDTAEAKIAGATRPRPFFKGVGAEWSKQRKCKRLQKFIDGEFDRTRVYRIGSQMVKDAGILGDSFIKGYTKNGKIAAERVLVSEILVDENLAFTGEPPELTHVKEVSKSLLAEAYKSQPKKHAAIMALTPVGTSPTGWSELVEVYETWSLKRGDKDGRHVITIPGCDLEDRPFKRERFPLVRFRWSEQPTGFYGQGIAHQVMGIQMEITRWFRNISKSLHLLANPRVLLANGGNLDPNHITNAWGTILKYQPPYKPEIWTSQIMPPEVYQWFENMYRKGFELAGFSQQSVFARKETGVESGKAMRELSDIQADRMAPKSVNYENVFVDLARLYVDLAEELFEENPEYSTVFQDTNHSERIRYADVRLSEEDYTIQVMAASFLSRTPSAAYDDIKDLMATELIDADEARSLMNFPDLQRIMDLDNADRNNAERMVELILDKGIYLGPQPYDDLQINKKIFKDAYAKARIDAVEEDRLIMLRRFLDENEAMIQEAAAAVAPPQPPAPQDPGAVAPQGMAA